MEKKVKFDFHYSKEDDILTIFDYSKSVVDTIEFSEFLNISVNKEGNIVGFEFFDASHFFKTLNSELDATFLSNLKGVELEQKEFRNNWFVVIWLKSDKKVISQPLPIFNKQTYESPLLSTA